MPDNHQRAEERIPILGDVRGEVMVVQTMTVKEISRRGAQIETAFPLALDSLHDFRLILTDRSIVVKGRVVHCRIVDVDQDLVFYRSGIEFVHPSLHAQNALDGFIDEIRRVRQRGEETT